MVAYPNICLSVAVIFPVIVFLFIYAMPTQDPNDKAGLSNVPTSWYFLKTILFTIVIFIVVIASLLALCSLTFKKITVRRIDSEISQNNAAASSLSE